jgi:hypothetical protein
MLMRWVSVGPEDGGGEDGVGHAVQGFAEAHFDLLLDGVRLQQGDLGHHLLVGRGEVGVPVIQGLPVHDGRAQVDLGGCHGVQLGGVDEREVRDGGDQLLDLC